MDFFTIEKKEEVLENMKTKMAYELIEKIISAGSLAYSGGNMQP